jgi:hypothetical protein
MEYSKHQFEGGVSGKDIKEAENHWRLPSYAVAAAVTTPACLTETLTRNLNLLRLSYYTTTASSSSGSLVTIARRYLRLIFVVGTIRIAFG